MCGTEGTKGVSLGEAIGWKSEKEQKWVVKVGGVIEKQMRDRKERMIFVSHTIFRQVSARTSRRDASGLK